MEKIKLTKTELKKQKDNLKRYNRYLPTLYIKKQQLRKEIERVTAQLFVLDNAFSKKMDEITPWISLLGEEVGLSDLIRLKEIDIKNDNIAGVDIPVFVKAQINIKRYDLFVYPLWIDRAIDILYAMICLQAEKAVLDYQRLLLSRELRITSQRVNLFEQVKIPEAKEGIRRISIYLGDQQTAAVVWARMAKKKLQEADK